MNILYPILLAFFLALGIFSVVFIAVRPGYFWMMLIFSIISGGEIMINGYGLMDEYLLLCLLLGVILVLLIRPAKESQAWENKSRFNKIHFQVFFFFMFYLTLQSIRGLVVLDDMRMIRFIIFFPMLGFLSFLLYKGFSPIPSPQKITNLVLASSLLYFSLYFGQGAFAEIFRNMNRFETQGFEWTGSGVAMYPLFCMLPSLYAVLRYQPRRALSRKTVFRQTWLGWAAFIAAVATSFYYDSRISWVALTGFLLLSMLDFKFSKILKIAIIFCALIVALSLNTKSTWDPKVITFRITNFYQSLFISATGQQTSDLDRKLANLSSLRLISESPQTLLFGTGFYTERYTLIPYYLGTLSDYGVRIGASSVINSIVRTATFPSFLAGTGLVGIILLLLCFYFTGLELLENTRGPDRKKRKIFLFTLFIVFYTTFITINLDLILFYLMIMPSGLLIQMSRTKARSNP